MQLFSAESLLLYQQLRNNTCRIPHKDRSLLESCVVEGNADSADCVIRHIARYAIIAVLTVLLSLLCPLYYI
jgi:hypothetical protein